MHPRAGAFRNGPPACMIGPRHAYRGLLRGSSPARPLPGSPTVLPVYLGSLALGGILILASLLLGGGDHDHDHDVHVDHDVDADVDAEVDHDLEGGLDKDLSLAKDAAVAGGGWMPFLSLRFWTFALATFGGAGAVLDLLGFSDPVSAVSASLTGVGVGLAVSRAFHTLKHTHVSGDVGLRQIGGREGTLLLAVGPEKLGKVRVQVDGQDVDLPARTQDEALLGIRERVLVVSVKDGVAEVTSVQPGRHPKDA